MSKLKSRNRLLRSGCRVSLKYGKAEMGKEGVCTVQTFSVKGESSDAQVGESSNVDVRTFWYKKP